MDQNTTFKNPLIAIKTKNPNRVWSKSWILDRLVGHIFPFEMIVHGTKSELKEMRYQQKTKTLIKYFTFFM